MYIMLNYGRGWIGRVSSSRCPDSLRFALVLIGGGVVSGMALPQIDSVEARAELASRITAEIGASSDCELMLHGRPRYEELTGVWHAAYSASGEACDAAGAALRERGEADGLTFVRRPTLGQLRPIVTRMLRSAESTTGCRLTLSGRPALDETTAYWHVRYLASGPNCDEAGRALRSQGAGSDILFMPRSSGGLINDVR